MRGVSANKPPMAASKCRLHITTTKFKKEKKKKRTFIRFFPSQKVF